MAAAPLRPVIAIYDEGAASPSDIAIGFEGHANLLFAGGASHHARSMVPLLEQLAPTVINDDLDRMCSQLRAFKPAGILTFSERAMPLAGAVAHRLGLRFHSPTTTARLTDKIKQRTAFSESGLDTIRFASVRSVSDLEQAASVVGYPLIIKPAQSGASRDTFVAADHATAQRLVAGILASPAIGFIEDGAIIIEEYIDGRDCSPFGDYVSVESVVQGGSVQHFAITGKLPMTEPFRETGRFWPSPIAQAEEKLLLERATAAILALGITDGLVHTEFKLTETAPRLIEVNGRLGGGINELAIRALGLNLVTLAIDVALGKKARVDFTRVDKIYFQMFHPAPRLPSRLANVSGISRVLDIPGVLHYRPYYRNGSQIDGGVHTEPLNFILGECADHKALAQLVDSVNRALCFEFEFANEDIRVRGDKIGEL